MTSFIRFLLFIGFRLISKLRTFLWAGGVALFGFFLWQSAYQGYAHLAFENALATALKVETGCLGKGEDRQGLRIVEPCSAPASQIKGGGTPYVTFRFTDSSGKSHSGRGAIGSVGMPRGAGPGTAFEIRFNPANPADVRAPLNAHYFSFTVPIGGFGAFLLLMAFLSKVWTNALQSRAESYLVARNIGDVRRSFRGSSGH